MKCKTKDHDHWLSTYSRHKPEAVDQWHILCQQVSESILESKCAVEREGEWVNRKRISYIKVY